ncbi:MAG: cell division protein FtsB [Gammaproteobacteria bacterium]
MRLVILVLVLVTAYLQYALWFQRGGIRDVDKLREALAAQREEIDRLEDRNQALAAEVIDLKQGLEAIEERARSDMGMIKQGEVFFRTPGPARPDGDAAAGTEP